MSPINLISGRFALIVWQQILSISEANTVEIPAFARPKSKPIAPVKKLKAISLRRSTDERELPRTLVSLVFLSVFTRDLKRFRGFGLFQQDLNFLHHLFEHDWIPQRVLPNAKNLNAFGAQTAINGTIPRSVASKFLQPEHLVGFWYMSAPWTIMPKAAVQEECQPALDKEYVRFTWQPRLRNPPFNSSACQGHSKSYLGCACVFSFD